MTVLPQAQGNRDKEPCAKPSKTVTPNKPFFFSSILLQQWKNE